MQINMNQKTTRANFQESKNLKVNFANFFYLFSIFQL